MLINNPECTLQTLKEKFPLDNRAYFLSETLKKAWRGSALLDNEFFEVNFS